MGLSLLSQPAQAIDWNFSYDSPTSGAVDSILTTDGTAFVTGTTYTILGISGTVNGNTITGLVSSVPTRFGGSFGTDNQFSWDGATGIIVTSGGIAFQDNSTPSARINYLYLTGAPGNYNTRNYSINANGTGRRSGANLLSSSFTPATAVPWETDALSVIGSTVLFSGGLWAKNKFAKPLEK